MGAGGAAGATCAACSKASKSASGDLQLQGYRALTIAFTPLLPFAVQSRAPLGATVRSPFLVRSDTLPERPA